LFPKLLKKPIKKLEDVDLTKCHHATPRPSMVATAMMQKVCTTTKMVKNQI
jgi:hypothetical protein